MVGEFYLGVGECGIGSWRLVWFWLCHFLFYLFDFERCGDGKMVLVGEGR